MNYLVKKMGTGLIYLILFLSYSTCISKEYANDIRCIRITRNFPVIEFNDSVGKIVKYDTLETRIYQYKNQEIYQTYYTFIHTSMVDSIPPVIENRCNFFVYTKGNTTGLYFDSTEKIIAKPVNVDSMLLRQRQFKLEVDDIYNEMSLTYIHTIKNRKTKDTEEWYSFNGKKDTTMTGSVLFAFMDPDKFKNIDYSFSKKLDSLRGMKLYKIVTVTNARYIGPPNNIYMDRGEIFQKFESIPVNNREEVLRYFNADQKFRIGKE